MVEQILVLNEFEKNDNINEYFSDMNGKVYDEAISIRDDNLNIALEEIFEVSPIIKKIKDITIILCQQVSENKCITVACMRHATIYRDYFNYNWQFCRYNIECDANDAFIIPRKQQKKYHIGKYMIDKSLLVKLFVKKVCVVNNCVKFDSELLDKRASKSHTFKEFEDITDEYNNALQHDKILKLWQIEYEKDKANVNVIYQLAISYMDCCEIEKARTLFEQVFEQKRDDQVYLSRLAIVYFQLNYIEETMNIANMIKDLSILEDWGYPYDYITSFAPVCINVDSVMNNEFVKHKVDLGFDRMPCPRIIIDKKGIKRYLDPIRNKGVKATKEETIRQKIIQYLLNVCNIPSSAITSEDHMAHYDTNATTRADITVRDGNDTLLIVECKEPTISIDGEPIRQLFGYNEIMNSKYLLLSNGTNSYIFQKNDCSKYESVLSLPDYKTMLSDKKVNPASFKRTILKRPSISEINSKSVIEQYRNDGMYLGVNTPNAVAPFILNLMWSFLDISCKVNNIHGYGIEIVEDNGLVDMTLTNVSGGKFPGCYRQFIVKDRYLTDCLIEFAVFGNYAESSTKGGYTSLVCGVSRTSQHIARLELRLDVSVDVGSKQSYLFHNGIRSRKKCQTTIDYVSSVCPKLVKDNKINLGTFPNNKLIKSDDNNVKDFILRLISYVLLRDEMSNLNIDIVRYK